MTAQSKLFYRIVPAIFACLQFFTYAAGQDVEVKIEVGSESGSVVRVTGRFPENSTVKTRRNLSFLRSFLEFGRLGERISNVVLKDLSGKVISYQTPIPSEFVADADIVEWSYLIDVSPRKEQNAAAHVSWLTKDTGLLMLGDVLPAMSENGKPTSAKVTIILPVGWRQMENRIDGIVATKDVAAEVVSIGTSIKYRKIHVGNTAITISTSGEWLFTSDELVSFCQQIYTQLNATFGSAAGNEVLVNVFKFSQKVGPGQWQAETRGRNVTIISSDMAFKTQSIQRLHEQLRHEIFHLWIPNGVNLSGNYDWFYEGFALYQSLKTALALNRIRFEDFLDTLSRAQAIDARQTNRLSLIDASGKRWNGADTYIYARGMVTAFLCDVLLLNNSKGKLSVENVLREIYTKHRFPAARTDGNAAVLSILGQNKELAVIIERYINGGSRFEWQPELDMAGLENTNGLKVKTKLNGRQKDLLDRLGYNNWRRL